MQLNHIGVVMTGVRNGTFKPVRREIRTVSFACPVEEASMLHAIANHYKIPISQLGVGLFVPIITALFNEMDDTLKQKLAAEADDVTTAWVAKGGSVQVVPNVPPINQTFWRNYIKR